VAETSKRELEKAADLMPLNESKEWDMYKWKGQGDSGVPETHQHESDVLSPHELYLPLVSHFKLTLQQLW
jgi:hypothetical protein